MEFVESDQVDLSIEQILKHVDQRAFTDKFKSTIKLE